MPRPESEPWGPVSAGAFGARGARAAERRFAIPARPTVPKVRAVECGTSIQIVGGRLLGPERHSRYLVGEERSNLFVPVTDARPLHPCRPSRGVRHRVRGCAGTLEVGGFSGSWRSSSESPAPTPGPPARGLRQLRHPQAPQRQGLADQAPPSPAALHPDQRQLNMVDLLRDHHPPSDPPRHLPLRQGPRDRHRDLHRRLERTRPPIHLDQRRRRDHQPRETHTPPKEDLRPATLDALTAVPGLLDQPTR